MPKLKKAAKMENLEQMINFVLEGIKNKNFNGKNKFLKKLRLVCEEAMVNIINYAYEDGVGDIEIFYDFSEEENMFILKLIDKGVAFNPLEIKEPDLDLSLEYRQIGGLGIYMIKTIMDNVEYKRENNQNILTLSKVFD